MPPPCRSTEFTSGSFRLAVNRNLAFFMPFDSNILCPRWLPAEMGEDLCWLYCSLRPLTLRKTTHDLLAAGCVDLLHRKTARMVTQRVLFGEVFDIRDQQALTADNVCP